MSDDNAIVFGLNPKPQAAWSFDPDFSFRFVVGRKKPNLIVRLCQRWFLGIYWRDEK